MKTFYIWDDENFNFLAKTEHDTSDTVIELLTHSSESWEEKLSKKYIRTFHEKESMKTPKLGCHVSRCKWPRSHSPYVQCNSIVDNILCSTNAAAFNAAYPSVDRFAFANGGILLISVQNDIKLCVDIRWPSSTQKCQRQQDTKNLCDI